MRTDMIAVLCLLLVRPASALVQTLQAFDTLAQQAAQTTTGFESLELARQLLEMAE